MKSSYLLQAFEETPTRKSENTEDQNEYLKGHILKSTRPRIKI